jgi:hypothetical protein
MNLPMSMFTTMKVGFLGLMVLLVGVFAGMQVTYAQDRLDSIRLLKNKNFRFELMMYHSGTDPVETFTLPSTQSNNGDIQVVRVAGNGLPANIISAPGDSIGELGPNSQLTLTSGQAVMLVADETHHTWWEVSSYRF